MKNIFLTVILLSFYFVGCDKVTNPPEELGRKITAKEKTDDVLSRARFNFASDAKLAAIYGWNVDLSGKVDLLKTDNAFVYVVQSNSLGSNDFWIYQFAGLPIRSSINFKTMLTLVKDSIAAQILGKVLNRLSKLAIDPSANYQDSPAIIDTALSNGGKTFLSQNSGVKIDMFLLPSKSIDTTLVVNNSADWIVNFYTNNKSLVLWINSNSGNITKLSAN